MRKVAEHFRISTEHAIVFCILLIAGFLRLYRIGDYLTFLGDEGRDVLVVKGILEGNFTLLGPRASAGDFFLGPIYYYLMAPFLFLWKLDPVGPAVMVGLFGIATVWLVYYVGKKFFSVKAGIFASALYAVSPVVIAYSRSSWNPNLMPFFSLFILLLLYVAVEKQKTWIFFLIGVLFGVTMQLHYLTVFLGCIVVLYLGIVCWQRQLHLFFTKIIKQILVIFTGFLIGFSPFLLFELRHGFPNAQAIFAFMFENSFEKEYLPSSSFTATAWNVFFRMFGRLVTRFPPPEQVSFQENIVIAYWYTLTIVLAASAVGIFGWQLYKYIQKKETTKARQYILILLWFGLGILLFGFYKKPIYDYYFGFMFAAPFLLIGNALSTISGKIRRYSMGIFLSVIIFLALFFFNLNGAPFFFPPNRQKDQVKTIADFVLDKTNNQPYNFALLTGGNSDHGYRYFFELAGRQPVTMENLQKDPERRTVTNQLLIVCEDVSCHPLGSSLWEVAGFGRAEVVGEWNVSVVKVYRLIHYEGK